MRKPYHLALTRVRDMKMIKDRSGSHGAPIGPVVFEVAVEFAAAQGDDGIGASNRPKHARLLEAAPDYGFAACFDYAGTDEEMLGAKRGVTHSLGVLFKVSGLLTNLFGQFWRGRVDQAKITNQLFDFALIQFWLVAQYP